MAFDLLTIDVRNSGAVAASLCLRFNDGFHARESGLSASVAFDSEPQFQQFSSSRVSFQSFRVGEHRDGLAERIGETLENEF